MIKRKLLALRRYVFLQSTAITIPPIICVGLLIWFFLLPLVRTNIVVQHQSVARAIAGQISAHLLGGQRQLLALAAMFAKDRYSAEQLSHIFDATCGTGSFFETVYLLDNASQRVESIGLAQGRRVMRADLLQLDLSGRSQPVTALAERQVLWSETFLSTVSSQMAVAVTIKLGKKLLVGEITLGNLSEFISLLPNESDLRIMVLDRQDRIVADSQKLDFGQKSSFAWLGKQEQTPEKETMVFTQDNQRVVGSIADIAELGWQVLIVQSYGHAFKPVQVVVIAASVGFVLALLMALYVAWHQGSNMASVVQLYVKNAKAIAQGEYDLYWPPAKTLEYEDLVESLQDMARQIQQREQLLVASENHLRITLESIGDGVITTDASGIITMLNPMAEQLTGWSASLAVGMMLSEVYAIIDDRTGIPCADAVVEVLAAGGDRHLETHTLLIARDGRQLQIADSGASILDGEGQLAGMVLVFRDVSESYAQQQKILENESRLRQLTANIPGVVYQFRSTRDHVYRNEFLSAKSAEIFGLEPDPETFIEAFHSRIPAEDQERYLSSVRHAIDTCTSWSYEGRFYHPAGHTIWFSSLAVPHREGQDIVFYGFLMDVTNRKEMEASLRLTQFCFDTASVGIFLMDENARILKVNEQACASLGYSREELCTLSVPDIDPDFADANLWPNFLSRLKQQGALAITTSHQRKNGDIFPIHVASEVMSFEGTEFVISFVSDISAQERAKQEQRELEHQLQQSQKIEAMGRLAGGVAHDLNNLLMPILGYGELLLLDAQMDDRAKSRIESMIKAGQSARDLVQQLLAFGRKQMLEYLPLDLNQVLVEFEPLFRRTIRENIEIVLVQASALKPIQADLSQVKQVLMNLLVNASDAMPEGGVLTIETAMALVGGKQDESVLLQVHDTGIGMDEHTLAHVFEPFFTTKGALGTGLGMATVYGIVKQHGGEIEINSKPGEGTRIQVSFPVAPEEESSGEKTAEDQESSACTGSETILLVEDNEHVRDTVCEILENYGYTVLLANNGQQAVDAIDTYTGTVDLLMTDVVMPGMNGKQLYTMLFLEYPHLRVLYMSGYTDDIIGQHGVLEEHEYFIQKPFTIEMVLEKVREVLSSSF